MRGWVDVITMGCSKNLVDSERLLFQLRGLGFRVYHNPKKLHHDIAIVNTCGFIGAAKEESINMILELCEAKQRGQLKRVFVTGCLSERFMGELLKEIPEVDRYYGKFDYRQLLSDLSSGFPQGEEEGRILSTPRHYAYVKISEGCNRQCGYCAIPIITGGHHSRPMEDVLREVETLARQKTKEFQVIAQELTYYGLDLYGERRLAQLVDRMADIKGVRWIRLHYGYPNGFPMDLLKVMRERGNVCKYLDIALQHASEGVLERMRRHTTALEQRRLIERLREEVPGICLRTTMMVGYPGESDDEFRELLDFVKWARFERLGAFAYSEEEGTWAQQNLKDDVPAEVKQERLGRLMAVQQEIAEEVQRARVGKVLRVIIDGKEGEFWVGRTEWDSPEVDGEVMVKNKLPKRLRRGDMVDVKITSSDEFDLYGETLESTDE